MLQTKIAIDNGQIIDYHELLICNFKVHNGPVNTSFQSSFMFLNNIFNAFCSVGNTESRERWRGNEKALYVLTIL